jgi:hypothetical protein
MSIEERVIKLEEFASDVRSFTKTLTEMMLRHEARLDGHTEMFREANHSIAALADAQIRTEDGLKQLTAAQKETNEKLNSLIVVVERFISGGNGSS